MKILDRALYVACAGLAVWGWTTTGRADDSNSVFNLPTGSSIELSFNEVVPAVVGSSVEVAQAKASAAVVW
jgi:hypothetical protein